MSDVTAENLTDEQVREHLAWLRAGEGQHSDAERREAIRQCMFALTPDGQRVVASWAWARERLAAAINARAKGDDSCHHQDCGNHYRPGRCARAKES